MPWWRRQSCLKATHNLYLGRSKEMPNLHLTASLSSSTAANNDPHPQKPWLIVGFGNPGKRFNSTRHNVGFEMVDRIAESEGISINTTPPKASFLSSFRQLINIFSFKAVVGKGFIGNIPVMLAKPQTFMNLSGVSVAAIVSYYKIPLKQVLVIYDDMDLPFETLRLLPKGGHGGHNGMKNIIDRLKGSGDFPRLRIGIGRPPGKMDAVNYVLRPFTKEEHQELDFVFQNGCQAVRILLREGFDKSANYVNSAKPLKIQYKLYKLIMS